MTLIKAAGTQASPRIDFDTQKSVFPACSQGR
jgi:hypothetical protein